MRTNRPRPRIYPPKPSEKAYSWFVEQFGIEDAPDEFTKRYKDKGDEFLPEGTLVEEPPKAPKEPPKAPPKARKPKKKKYKGEVSTPRKD